MLHTCRVLHALDLPSIPTIIDPWLPTASISLVFGPPSAGKSLWMMSVAHALTSGGSLFGAYNCAKSRVLIVQADMPVSMVQERLQAGTVDTDDILMWLTENRQLDIVTAHRTHATEIAEIRAFDPQVVFVDTLRKTHTLDENDSAAPDRVYAAWRAILPNATFIFLHHSRKVSNQPASPDVAVREAFRGSIAWAASADTIISIRRARRRGSKDWLVQQRFVRTRGCQEPPALLLRSTDELLLEPIVATMTLEDRLTAWIMDNPKSSQLEAVAWLRELRDAKGRALCDRRRAYRVFDRVAGTKPL